MPPKSPQQPQPDLYKEEIGTLVEKFRSYERDVARLKGIHLEESDSKPVEQKSPTVPEKTLQSEIGNYEIAGKKEYLDAGGQTLESMSANNTFKSEVEKENPEEARVALHPENIQPTSSAIHTIQTDAAEFAKDQKTTVENIVIAAEEERRTSDTENNNTRNSVFILALSLILILGGAVSLGVIYLVRTGGKAPAPIFFDPSVILISERSLDIVLSGDESIQTAILTAKSQSESNKPEIIKLSIKESADTPAIDGPRFATMFSQSAPTWLVRSFKPEYFAGLYKTKEWQPFFIFKLSSYETSYAGMLKWEETLLDDMRDLLAVKNPEIKRTLTPTATTSSATPSVTPVLSTGFRDIIIKNKDVRVLEDTSGRRLILYSFIDKETLVIAVNQAALEEIFARLSTSKFVR